MTASSTTSSTTPPTSAQKVALITGSAKRLGRQMVKTLHQHHYKVIIHCHHSIDAANALAAELNQIKPATAKVICFDITDEAVLSEMVLAALTCFGRLDLLINNASSFYPTDTDAPNAQQWQDLIGTNMKAPYLLSCLCKPHLRKTQGNIINLVDIHAQKPLKGHTIYCMAKAGLEMMVKSLACEFAPDIRVNGISPGAILWPEQPLEQKQKSSIINQIVLKRLGKAEDIANAAIFLAQSPYITGQVLAVDGGRSLLGANIA